VRRIAQAIGAGKSTVAEDVDALLAELVSVRTTDTEKARTAELEKLATCEAAALDILTAAETDPGAQDPDVVMRAVDRVVKVQERRAKLLGLDAPERHELSTVESELTPARVRELAQEQFGRVTPAEMLDAAPKPE
jgi:hypothetical protein